MNALEKLVARHCAATILGEKTGSLVRVSWAHYQDHRHALQALRSVLLAQGVSVRVFGTPAAALMYVYRPELLKKDLRDHQAREILARYGYGPDVFSSLQNRLMATGGFPHEIGLFIGYPAQDVAGFIDHGGANCILTGCWKVYHDADRARCLFCTYSKCRERMNRLIERGMTLSDILRSA